jgi:beta-lactam-binding protein with PASTA domain
MTVRRAPRAITRAGCILIRTKRRTAHVRRGRAVRTSPRAGRRVGHLAFVVLYVSRGRAR